MGKKRGSKKRSSSMDQAASCAVEDLTATMEDLSMQRHDEETALSAIYGNDFSLESGAWNCPLYKIRIRRASEVTDHGVVNEHANNADKKKMELTLQIQLNKKYPYSVPMIQLKNLVGIPIIRMSELLNLLQAKAKECANLGAVMGWELGQVVEEFLADYSQLLEEENKQRERDLVGKYKSNTDDLGDFDNYKIDESDGADDHVHVSNPPSPGRESLDSDVQKEMARKMQALDEAEKIRQQRRQERGAGMTPSYLPKQSENGKEIDIEDDIFHFSEEYNLDFDLPPTSGTSTFSRYETDFVELAPLGRGGGGEVVKAINRLDRRIYAIKRIVLESEEFEDDTYNRGSKTKNPKAVVQNQKLRREVTTISRMTHKNIVRYYQAWVESNHQGRLMDTSHNTPTKSIQEEPIKSNNHESSGYSWSSSTNSSSSSSSSDEPIEDIIRKPNQQTTEYARSLSLGTSQPLTSTNLNDLDTATRTDSCIISLLYKRQLSRAWDARFFKPISIS
jgi:translation initiation factor 2-alpha kinase 4